MCSSGSHSCSILLRRQQALSQLLPLSVRRRLISLVYSGGFDAEDFDAVSPGGISAFPGSISSRAVIKTCLALRTW